MPASVIRRLRRGNHATLSVVGLLRPFEVGSNAGGGEGVIVLDTASRQRRKVYRYVTRSIGGRPIDTAEETEDWRDLRAIGLV